MDECSRSTCIRIQCCVWGIIVDDMLLMGGTDLIYSGSKEKSVVREVILIKKKRVFSGGKGSYVDI